MNEQQLFSGVLLCSGPELSNAAKKLSPDAFTPTANTSYNGRCYFKSPNTYFQILVFTSDDTQYTRRQLKESLDSLTKPLHNHNFHRFHFLLCGNAPPVVEAYTVELRDALKGLDSEVRRRFQKTHLLENMLCELQQVGWDPSASGSP